MLKNSEIIENDNESNSNESGKSGETGNLQTTRSNTSELVFSNLEKLKQWEANLKKERNERLAVKRGYKNYSEFLADKEERYKRTAREKYAREKGFTSHADYLIARKLKPKFDHNQYVKEQHARKKGFANHEEYKAWKTQQRIENEAKKKAEKKTKYDAWLTQLAEQKTQKQIELMKRESSKVEQRLLKEEQNIEQRLRSAWYKAKRIFWAGAKVEIKADALARNRARKLKRNMEKTGSTTVEEYEATKKDRKEAAVAKLFGSKAQREENKIRRDQWRNYRRLAKNGESTGGRIPKGWITTLWVAQDGKCGICGKELDTEWHIDHILPISKGGPNVSWNLQLTHSLCNIVKGAG